MRNFENTRELVLKARSITNSHNVPLNFGSCVAISMILSGIVNIDLIEISKLEDIQKDYLYYSEFGWDTFIKKYEDWDNYVFQKLIKDNSRFLNISKPVYPLNINSLASSFNNDDKLFVSILTNRPHLKGNRPITHRVFIQGIDIEKNKVTLLADLDPRMKCILTTNNPYFTKWKNYANSLDKDYLSVSIDINDLLEIADITHEALLKYYLAISHKDTEKQSNPWFKIMSYSTKPVDTTNLSGVI